MDHYIEVTPFWVFLAYAISEKSEKTLRENENNQMYNVCVCEREKEEQTLIGWTSNDIYGVTKEVGR